MTAQAQVLDWLRARADSHGIVAASVLRCARDTDLPPQVVSGCLAALRRDGAVTLLRAGRTRAGGRRPRPRLVRLEDLGLVDTSLSGT